MYVKKIQDFVPIPRQFNRDLQEGKINYHQLNILNWIFGETLPHTGNLHTSYKILMEQINGEISYSNMRKIISLLRAKKYIWFPNNRGKKDSLVIYPMYYWRSNKWQQLPEEFDFENFQTFEEGRGIQGETSHNSDYENHSFVDFDNPTNITDSEDAPPPNITIPLIHTETDTQTGTETDTEQIINPNSEA